MSKWPSPELPELPIEQQQALDDPEFLDFDEYKAFVYMRDKGLLHHARRT